VVCWSEASICAERLFEMAERGKTEDVCMGSTFFPTKVQTGKTISVSSELVFISTLAARQCTLREIISVVYPPYGLPFHSRPRPRTDPTSSLSTDFPDVILIAVSCSKSSYVFPVRRLIFVFEEHSRELDRLFHSSRSHTELAQ